MSQYLLRVSTKGIFFDNNGRILLVRGKSLHNGEPFWCLPGGGVEDGESLFTALERELTEETGYFGKAKNIVFVQDLEWPNSGRNIEIFMTGELEQDKNPLPDHDHEFAFISEQEFKTLKFLPEVDPFEIKHNHAEYRTYL